MLFHLVWFFKQGLGLLTLPWWGGPAGITAIEHHSRLHHRYFSRYFTEPITTSHVCCVSIPGKWEYADRALNRPKKKKFHAHLAWWTKFQGYSEELWGLSGMEQLTRAAPPRAALPRQLLTVSKTVGGFLRALSFPEPWAPHLIQRKQLQKC